MCVGYLGSVNLAYADFALSQYVVLVCHRRKGALTVRGGVRCLEEKSRRALSTMNVNPERRLLSSPHRNPPRPSVRP